MRFLLLILASLLSFNSIAFAFEFGFAPSSAAGGRSVFSFKQGGQWIAIRTTDGANVKGLANPNKDPVFVKEAEAFLGIPSLQNALLKENRDSKTGKAYDFLTEGTAKTIGANSLLSATGPASSATYYQNQAYEFGFVQSKQAGGHSVFSFKQGGQWIAIRTTDGANVKGLVNPKKDPAFVKAAEAFLGVPNLQSALLKQNTDPQTGRAYDFLSKTVADNMAASCLVSNTFLNELKVNHFNNNTSNSGYSSSCLQGVRQQKSSGPKEFSFYEKGQPGYILTNLEASSFVSGGIHYPSSEHFFQANKWPKNHACFKAVLQAKAGGRDPFLKAKECEKTAGGKVDQKDWFSRRDNLMCQGLWEKFSQDSTAKAQLCSHPDTVLIENAGENDAYWGNGKWNTKLGKAEPGFAHYVPGTNNKLGESLMWVASQLCTGYQMPTHYESQAIQPHCAVWSQKGRP